MPNLIPLKVDLNDAIVSQFQPGDIVDPAYLPPSSSTSLSRTVVNTASFNNISSYSYLGVTYNGDVTINLNEGVDGQEIIIKDERGKFKITVIPFSGEEIDGDTGGFVSSIKYASYRLVFFTSLGGWSII